MYTMINSFKYAIRGVKDALRSEHNLRIHFLAALIALVAAKLLKFSITEFAVLVLTISFVIISELMNTIIEKIVDMHSKEISEKARVIKDISAAIVLFAAITSVVVGIILFIPKLTPYMVK